MATIKCKMCGGDLNVTEGMTVAECEYCGTKQTVPNVDNEKKLTLFSRANRLRLACEFDKAAGVYENVVSEFPTEAEAYWGLVLCRYGIEYVDDPATGKKVPTCHRSSFDSILEDSDFEQACENADAIARRVYRDEAKTIEDIRKGILEVSGKEPPYDIFICYKETDDSGERTVDSVLAQDVYDALTDKGYRVFFSRITLEDKLGTEYEPYIFAALNSAKVMLVFGSDYEYFNAVWVKNEWSRFLKLMVQDKNKHLIPCYKNVDAYDMPKEFQKLQGQDMGKVGAVQDLLRGIDKLLGRKATAPAPQAEEEPAPARPNVAALLERGELSLEDRNWEKARALFDQALNLSPRCAEAYLGLAQCACQAATREEFTQKWPLREGRPDRNVQRALQFAGPELRAWLEGLEQERTARAERREQGQAEQRERRRHLEPLRQRIAVGKDFVAGLRSDGTVAVTGSGTDARRREAERWSSVVAIVAVKDVLIGLTANGMVLSAQPHAIGRNDYADLHDVIAIEKSNQFAPEDAFYHDKHALLVMRADGTVILCGLDGLNGIRHVLATGIASMYINADGEKWTGTSNRLIGVDGDGIERVLGECRRYGSREEQALSPDGPGPVVTVINRDPESRSDVTASLYGDGTVTSSLPDDLSGPEWRLFESLEGSLRDRERMMQQAEAERVRRRPVLAQCRERARRAAPLISCGGYGEVFAVQADGTVCSTKKHGTEAWRDMVAVSSGDKVVKRYGAMEYTYPLSIVGLRSDCTLAFVERHMSRQEQDEDFQLMEVQAQETIRQWTDIREIAVHTDEYLRVTALRRDGTVVSTSPFYTDSTYHWRGVVSFVMSGSYCACLLENGTVRFGGAQNYDALVQDWQNIVSLAFVTVSSLLAPVLVGLRDDGTVVATGPLSNEAAQWTDITTIAAAGSDLYGVRMDGTVVVARSRSYLDWCVDKIEEWGNIAAVFPCCYLGNHYAVIGLRNDGTVIVGTAGARETDRTAYRKAQKWRLFNSLDTLEQERAVMKNQAGKKLAEAQKRAREEEDRRRTVLEEEKSALQTELANLKGIFFGSRRRQVVARLAEIEAELKKL